jgi:hypothetical protein
MDVCPPISDAADGHVDGTLLKKVRWMTECSASSAVL